MTTFANRDALTRHSPSFVPPARHRHALGFWIGLALLGSAGWASAGTGAFTGAIYENAKVCLDANGNGICDPDEITTRSSHVGTFTLPGTGVDIVAEIGTDAEVTDTVSKVVSPVKSRLVLRAPKEAPGFIGFHSTSVVEEMEVNKLDFGAALAKVASSVGVPANLLLSDIEREADNPASTVLRVASDTGLRRIGDVLASAPEGADIRPLLAEAALTDRYYQTKTPYRPRQNLSTYEPAPAGFDPVYTELVARHGSRGLANPKYDLLVLEMWRKARQEHATLPLGDRLGDDIYKIIKANALMGYGVNGISKPGYGNETAMGIAEHTELAARMAMRLPGLWTQLEANARTAPRQIVAVTSGVDRAVDSGYFFVESLKRSRPALAPLLRYPPAPAPYPDTGKAVTGAIGTDRFELYFHKLNAATDLVTRKQDPRYAFYQESLAYQDYLKNDPDLHAKQARLNATPEATAAGRVLLERLFKKEFVDKIESGQLRFSNTGSFSFRSNDGKFTAHVKGDGKGSINSLGDAASALYDVYVIAPSMQATTGVDFSPYMPLAQAQLFSRLGDASDFYDKGPGMTEKFQITSRMAQPLVDDFFDEVDAIARGDRTHAAKLRFAHAETVMPFAVRMGLKTVSQPLPKAMDFSYDNSPWRGEYVAPMASNMQWDVYADANGKLLVKMLFNEKETDFKAACDDAKLPGTRTFYEYTKLRTCYRDILKPAKNPSAQPRETASRIKREIPAAPATPAGTQAADTAG